MDILERIDGLEAKFHEVSLLITDPSVIADQARYVRLNREYRDLERVLESAEKYKKAVNNLAEAKEIFYNESDADLREMARAEMDELSKYWEVSKITDLKTRFTKYRQIDNEMHADELAMMIMERHHIELASLI